MLDERDLKANGFLNEFNNAFRAYAQTHRRDGRGDVVVIEPSEGQQTALAQIATCLSDLNLGNVQAERLNRGMIIELKEGVGGSGKSQILQSIKTILGQNGIEVLDDEVDPFLTNQSRPGIYLCTGRVFDPERSVKVDTVINVSGFTANEIITMVKEGAPELLGAQSQLIGKWSLGSRRLAQILLAKVQSEPTDKLSNLSFSLCTEVAKYLFDRIPNTGSYHSFHDFKPAITQIVAEYTDHSLTDQDISFLCSALMDVKKSPTYRLQQVIADNGLRQLSQTDKIAGDATGLPMYTLNQSTAIYLRLLMHFEHSRDTEPRVKFAAEIPKLTNDKLDSLLQKLYELVYNKITKPGFGARKTGINLAEHPYEFTAV